MSDRNLAWHRKGVATIINFSDGAASQDFAGATSNAEWEKIDAAINEAGRSERNLAILEGGQSPLRRTYQKVWAASAVTFDLPSFIAREAIISVHDVTDSAVGFPIYVSERWQNHTTFFIDAQKLQWGTTGPDRATTLEFSYIAQPNTLKEHTDEADWLAYDHRDLLNWSAAAILRDIADEQVPLSWTRRLEHYRELYHMALSRGVPTETNPARIRNHRQVR